MNSESSTRYRPVLHARMYFWIALLAGATVPALLIAHAITGSWRSASSLSMFAGGVAALQALFWLSLRRCSTDELPAWRGLQHITSCMTIGIGSTSLFIAVPTTLLAILGMMGIASLSLLEGEGSRAPERFRAMVVWFGRHRMYQ